MASPRSGRKTVLRTLRALTRYRYLSTRLKPGATAHVACYARSVQFNARVKSPSALGPVPRDKLRSMKQLDPASAEAVTAAVRELESKSCAEVVVEIRSRSGSYAHAHARFAALCATIAIAGLLLSRWSFHPISVIVDVVIVYAVALFVAKRSDAIARIMTTAKERAAQVRMAAAAAFFERGVASTSRETGVLLYLSLLERRIELLADRGVLESVPTLSWNQLASESRERNAGIPELLGAIRSLAPLVCTHLPRRADDADELPNAPRFVSE
jgi:putative membrane protein